MHVKNGISSLDRHCCHGRASRHLPGGGGVKVIGWGGGAIFVDGRGKGRGGNHEQKDSKEGLHCGIGWNGLLFSGWRTSIQED